MASGLMSDGPHSHLLREWFALREAAAANPSREAIAACELAGRAWERAAFGGTMRHRYSASGRDGCD